MVDDRPDDIDLLKLMFKRSRIMNPVQSVGTVEDAIRYLKGEGTYSDRQTYPFPALILIDVRLPDGSGFDVLRFLRKNKVEAPLAAVVLSGSDIHAFRQAYELGAHSFLTKPLKFEDFQNMVAHVRGIKLTKASDGYLLEAE